MANVQPDKFTKIANELLEAIVTYKFNGTQLRLLLLIIRYTYGFNRKEADLSLTFLSNGIHSNKDQVKREVNFLIDKNVLIVMKKAEFDTSRVMSLNKDYDKWMVEKSGLTSTQGADLPTGVESATIQGADLPPSTGGGFTHQEIHSFKDNIKETPFEFFERVWILYPHKKGKSSITDADKKKLQKIGFDEIKRCIDRYKVYVDSKEWLHYQDGRRFFKSTYDEYLDKNHIECEKNIFESGVMLPGGGVML